MFLQVDERELATILAALRLWQEQDAPPCRQYDVATDCGELEPLDPNEIDALCERINGDDELPGQLVAALERAIAACESHSAGGQIDYDWIGEAEKVIRAAYAAGMGPKISPELKRLLMAEIDNEEGDQPATLKTVKDSLDSGYKPYDGFPVSAVKAELTELIERLGGDTPAERFVSTADWESRATC